MTSIGTGYDLSVTTYSPDGRIFQVEYANKAVENSGCVLAGEFAVFYCTVAWTRCICHPIYRGRLSLFSWRPQIFWLVSFQHASVIILVCQSSLSELG